MCFNIGEFSGGMAFLGVMDRWAEDESAELDSALWRLYGWILRLSFLFPSWTQKERLKTVVLLIWYVFVVWFHGVLLLVTIFREKKNLKILNLLLHYLVLGGAVSIMMVIFQFNRKLVAYSHRYFMGDMWKYCTGRIYSDERVKEIQRRIDEETKKLVQIPTGMTVFVGTALCMVTYMKSTSAEEITTQSELSVTLPLPLWYPFETHRGLSHTVTYALQLGAIGSLGLVSISASSMLYHLGQKIRFEYKVLGHSVDTLLDRAFQLYQESHPDRLPQEVERLDTTFQYYVGLCLRDSLHHHKKVIKMARKFGELITWIVALVYLSGTIAIGLSLINIIWFWRQADYKNIAVFGLLALIEVMNMMLVSGIGEALTTDSIHLREKLYFMDWHKLNVKNRKDFLLFQVGLTEPVIMKTGLRLDIRLDTFKTIMKSAYSFFNLMNMGTE